MLDLFERNLDRRGGLVVCRRAVWAIAITVDRLAQDSRGVYRGVKEMHRFLSGSSEGFIWRQGWFKRAPGLVQEERFGSRGD